MKKLDIYVAGKIELLIIRLFLLLWASPVIFLPCSSPECDALVVQSISELRQRAFEAGRLMKKDKNVDVEKALNFQFRNFHKITIITIINLH